MDTRNKYYITAVRTAIVEVLRCTDPAFTEEIFSFFSALFLKAYQRPLSNCKSKYRVFFTKYCKLLWYQGDASLIWLTDPLCQSKSE